MNASPRVSVVVVTRNRAARLGRLLRSLREQTLDPDGFEVIVVDDRSEDGTAELVASEAETATFELRGMVAGEDGGLAAVRNRAWRAARGPLVGFVDDDCEATPAWLDEGMRAAVAHPGAAIQGRTLPIPGELDRNGPLARTKLIEEAGPWYQTCNIFYPRELLERLGGFDERFTVAGEDTDLGWRAREAGAAIEFAPGALVHHAVEEIGAGGWLRIALRERPLAVLFRDHAGLRAEVARLGVFKGDERARFVLALAGLALAGRFRPAALLALPYARLLAARCRATNAAPYYAAWFAAYDAVALTMAARGAWEHRAPLV
jgi:GT2 family glycosyltransferase